MIINYGPCVIYLAQNAVEMCTLAVTTIPASADVELIAPGYTQLNNRIRVPKDTVVRCEVYNTGYIPYTELVTVSTSPLEKTFTLEQSDVVVTINPTPADAIVTLTIDGFDYVMNSSSVSSQRSFSYKVEKEGYATYTSEPMTISTSTTIPVTLDVLNPVNLDNFEYTMDSNYNATIIDYTGTDPDVTIP